MASTTRNYGHSALLLSFAAAVMLTAGCSRQAAAPAAPAVPAPLPLTLTTLEVMRAAVQIPADGIWAVQYEEKLSDPAWLLLDQDASDLAAAATLVSTPGSGKNDKAWAANADWQAWSLDLQKTALQVREAAKTRDLMKLQTSGDHLQEICQACHDKYRPQVPSDGVVRYPFYPKRVMAPE
jgi:hypothetical protein